MSEKNHEPIPGPKPGDHIVRVKGRKKPTRLKRVLGVGSLFSMAYGDVGSSIYYAMGITAFYALGATPIAIGIAGIFFLFTAYTYAEGSAMIPKSGGSCAYAQKALGDFWGFISGWGLMLVYVVTIALSSLSAAYYLAYFFPAIKETTLYAFALALFIILGLGIINFLGVREASSINIFFVLLDLLLQLSLVVAGTAFLFNAKKLLGYINWSGSDTWPTFGQLPYAIAVGMVGYVGLEATAQVVEETRQPQRALPRALLLTVYVVLFLFLTLPMIALSAIHPQELRTRWLEDPVAGIAHYLPLWEIDREGFRLQLDLSKLFSPAVAMMASTILIVASNAAMTAASRLSFSMSRMKLLPDWLNVLHKRFRTPYVTILLVVGSAILLLLPAAYAGGFVLKLGDLYRFGAMLAFVMAHLSILVLRFKEPDLERPFTSPMNLPIGRFRFPLTAVMGFLATLGVWLSVVIYSPWGRAAGFGWILLGLVIYLSLLKQKKARTGESAWG